MRSVVTGVLAVTTLVAASLTACDHGSLRLARPGSGVGGPAASAAPAVPGAPSPTWSAPRRGRTTGTLDIISGFPSVSVRVGDIGDDLFRITAIAPAATQPIATLTGDTVTITSAAVTGGSGSGSLPLQLTLSPLVTWSFALDGGTSIADVDLSGGHASSARFSQGVSSIRLTLPPAAGTVSVIMAGGASEFQVHLLGRDAVRANIAGGAGSASFLGVSHTGVAGGTVFTSPDWSAAPDRYDIDCSAGVSSLIVDRS
jgi:hypothetical protein